MEDFYKKAQERKEGRTMKNKIEEKELEEGNAFSEARCEAICSGEKSFKLDGKEYKVTDVDMSDKKACGCKSMKESKKHIKLTESELIGLIERIVNEEKVVTQNILNKNLKTSKDENDQNLKDVAKKMGDYIWTVIYCPIRYCFIAWTMYFSLRFLYAIIHFILVIIT